MVFTSVRRFEEILTETAPFMSTSVEKCRKFGTAWEAEFEDVLARLLPSDEKMRMAAEGYVQFIVSNMRLQKRFEKELKYINKRYSDVARDVYHNHDYMCDVYLPAIVVNRYLWPHHYLHSLFFTQEFLPLIQKQKCMRFADVGVGTGFYSRQILSHNQVISGDGYDISEYSLEYAYMHMKAYGYEGRWTAKKQNILTDLPSEKYDAVVSVEVLEHLEDPVDFIKQMHAMLAPTGIAFITAAIAAAEDDHIYLYMNNNEVRNELEQGGFKVLLEGEFRAYEPINTEPVPTYGAFICQPA